jgi:D-3-phosphoglycerate dehydrogenase
MYTIQTLNKISAEGLSLLERDKFEVASEIKNPQAIIVRSAKMHDMEIPSTVLSIARAGAGVNNIPVEKCTDAGIVVFNTPGANANSVKELVLAGLFLSSRKITEGITWAQGLKGQGAEVSKTVEKDKGGFTGPEISGKTLGVIGLGAIGVLVANAALHLGMNVLGYDPFLSVDAAWGLSPSVQKAASLDSLLAKSDYISLHIPQNDQTTNLLNAAKFGIMKKGIRIMNFARGGLVSNKDLLAAIGQGIVERYVTDFPEDELLGNPAVIPVPHLGASTPEAEENCAVMSVKQTKSFLEDGTILNSVNFPNCSMERGNGARLLIANKNVPNMLSQILAALADNNINVDDMVNKHRDTVAYNIIDVSQPVINEAIIKKIAAVDGIIRVRVLNKEV